METITIVVTLVLIFLSCLFLKWYLKWKKMADIVNRMPGPKVNPLIGTNLERSRVARDDMFEYYCTLVKKYGPVFRTWSAINPEVHIMKPEDVKIILSNQEILDKSQFYEFLHPWLGKGLLTNTGSSWRSRRKLLIPAFHFSILKNFMPIFVEKSEILVNERLNGLADGREFDIYPEIHKCALDIICKTAMGVDVNAMTDTKNEYCSTVLKMLELTLQRMYRVWLHPDLIFYNVNAGKRYKKCLKILHGLTNKILAERRQEIRNKKQNQINETNDDDISNKKHMAFLDLLLEYSMHDADFSDTNICEEVNTFMAAGNDTSATSICYTLYLLGNNPDIQDKVAEELDEIFDQGDRSITLQDITNMKYLDRVIKESLRLYPSIPYITRKSNQTLQIGGYEVPPGTSVITHIYDMHRDPELYPDPLKFDPDRFLPEVCKDRHQFAYVPFSAGPRNCIGQKFALLEEKTVLVSILRKYRINSVETPDKMKFYPEITLRGQNGIRVTMARR